MKNLIIASIALFSVLAFADTFELIKDGKTYSCSEKISSNPSAVIACLKSAQGYDGNYLSKDQATALCQGAKDASPVACAKAAQGYDGNYLSKDEAVSLCRGAVNSSSISCVKAAQGYDGNYLSKPQAMKLCQGATDNSPVSCAKSAQGYDGNYLSKDEAVEICKANANFVISGEGYVKKLDMKKTLDSFKRQFNLIK